VSDGCELSLTFRPFADRHPPTVTSRPQVNRAEPASAHQLAVRKQHNTSDDDWNRNRDSEGKTNRTPLPSEF